ncbi:hypothetical protein [Streptomyces sp. NPDC060366]|uniref:hypothetical protein n=1 Tax=Streptomyces sp. NPDC060366 TaxID=3347105 RepID=UPI00364F2B94
MAKLVRAVFVRDPDRHRTVLLRPGQEPEPRLAALITNPDCWEDGVLPGTEESKSTDVEPDKGSADTDSKPAAKPAAKKTAARKTAAN